ncbi:MAG TPA: zinc ABC transporter substrate-binding protein [Actinomycetota bacterium]|nr:zinc ABC transporter substrate-binding protein [Actinomycetota bacterium]
MARDPGETISVVASFYPLAHAAETVGGEAVTVTNLTPPGIEPHDLELAPQALEQIASADVVVYLSGDFQPAVAEAVEREAAGLIVDVAVEPAGQEATPGAPATATDPHVWLDPARYADLVEQIAAALAGVTGAPSDSFRANARRFGSRLDDLAVAFRAGLAACESRTMITNHAAFGHLAAAYDLEQLAISGISPESEPDAARIADLAALARRSGATVVFAEDLASAEAAETVAAEAGLGTAVLSPLEGLTESQLAAGDDYLSVMYRNLETLRDGLVCA